MRPMLFGGLLNFPQKFFQVCSLEQPITVCRVLNDHAHTVSLSKPAPRRYLRKSALAPELQQLSCSSVEYAEFHNCSLANSK